MAIRSPEGRMQNDAAPLKKSSLFHSNEPVLLTENSVSMSPAIVLGSRIVDKSPEKAENCAVVPFAYCAKSRPANRVYVVACKQFDVDLPL